METMASNTAKYESKSIKRKKDKENIDPETQTPTNIPSTLSDSPQVEDIATMMKDLSKEVNLLFSNYAKTLSERSTVDSLHVREFDKILEEARSLEIQIRQKKENLRNHLSMIAKTLQR
ncbi:testis-expressed protein 12 [Hyla sarda]|uniref:testis-expressed protein 12 n=1 Tax=Hyla sarda TaxID=327740 RepID=UPI0024C35DF0|nr:testis-expressed protein 12 [Hyla sarda]